MISLQTQEQVVQCFAPKEIITSVTQVAKDDDIIAFRVASTVTYQINGAGPTATLAAGTIMGFHPRIESIDFTTPVTLEVM